MDWLKKLLHRQERITHNSSRDSHDAEVDAASTNDQLLKLVIKRTDRWHQDTKDILNDYRDSIANLDSVRKRYGWMKIVLYLILVIGVITLAHQGVVCGEIKVPGGFEFNVSCRT